MFSQGLPAIAQHFQCEIITTELCLMLIKAFIVTLWLIPDRFFQRLNTVAANDPSTQSITANAHEFVLI
jgi:hypothetical protein